MAAATTLRGAPLLLAPTLSSPALLGLLRALARAQRSRSPSQRTLSRLLSCGRSTSSAVYIAKRLWRWSRDKLASPHIFLCHNQSTEQRAADRCPLPSVPRHAKQRGGVYAKEFGIDTFNNGGAPMLRPEALPSHYQWPPSPRHVRLRTATSCVALVYRTDSMWIMCG